ncbi:alkaline phosphatase PafA [Chitinophaga lutea]
MKNRIWLLLGMLGAAPVVHAQETPRPKIVVGMMVDQMRWDFLYRYNNRYGQGGIRRLTQEGFKCENTLINYAPTVTACGHTSVYTGSVPAVHGIVDNDWYDRLLKRNVYCAEDTTVRIIGLPEGKTGKGMSPRNMLATTVTDELRVATNFQSRVVGVALKDRGSIFPAGHSANAAFWYDGGRFVTSSFYMNDLPEWAQRFNAQQRPKQLLGNGWSTLYPLESYTQSTADAKDYENKFGHESAPVFPHKFSGKEESSIRSTPFGNTLTLEFARAAIEGYGLGNGKATDFIAISLSSPDAIGHQFGPNSIETEDGYLRLDKDLEAFFKYLDARFGKGNYLFFITADHGVAHSPGFLDENRLPTGSFDGAGLVKDVNKALSERFGVPKGVVSTDANQLYLDREAFAAVGADMSAVEKTVVDVAMKQPGVAAAIRLKALGETALPEPAATMFVNGYNRQRGGDVLIIMQPGWKEGSRRGATHGLWYPYDAHIPLVFMGWKIKAGSTYRTTGMTDIAPTVAALLHIQMPSGNVGHVITEVMPDQR